eukprot:1985491-Amphidinium_carterae.1
MKRVQLMEGATLLEQKGLALHGEVLILICGTAIEKSFFAMILRFAIEGVALGTTSFETATACTRSKPEQSGRSPGLA